MALSVLHIVEHVSSGLQCINVSRQRVSVNTILMFKPYADNKARMDYITQTHGNEAGWYTFVGRPFEMKYSSRVTM